MRRLPRWRRSAAGQRSGAECQITLTWVPGMFGSAGAAVGLARIPSTEPGRLPSMGFGAATREELHDD